MGLFWVSLIFMMHPPFMNVSVYGLLELKPIESFPSMSFGGFGELKVL